MNKKPSLSASKFSRGKTFEGADCKDAGPFVDFPDNGSYALP